MLTSDFITIKDIYLAYRKAKQEAFFDTFHSNPTAFAEFEHDLHQNLFEVYKELVESDSSWSKNNNFIGGFSYIPKSIDDSKWNKNESIHYRSVDPNVDWSQRYKENQKIKLDPEYRLIITATVKYQIISALWVIKVGQKLEEKLDITHSYGNRLRRYGYQDLSGDKDYILNENSTGLFQPYFTAYKSWRQKGLDAMKELLKSGKDVTAVTMDIASFYHNISPKFLLKPSFLRTLGVELTSEEIFFTQKLIESIETWYSNTPDYKMRPEGAIPVGLSASKIISNVLLYELDRDFVSGISPKYYGRYVDDIFVVFETPDNTLSGNAIMSYISNSVGCVKLERVKGLLPNLRVKLNYAEDSYLEFKAKKQKIFSLSSEHGADLIYQISSQIREQSSEYRMLPLLPSNSVKMAEKTLLVSSDASLTADALRKADVLAIRRLGLSLLIRDIERYSADLRKNEWITIRKEFYGLTERHLLTPKGFFEYSSYYSRIFQVMISNHDFIEAKNFIDKLISTFELIKETTHLNSKLKQDYCKGYFKKSLQDTALKASTVKNFDKWAELDDVINHLSKLSIHSYQKIDSKLISLMLLTSDLGLRPYKEFWYYEQSQDASCISRPKQKDITNLLRLPLIDEFRKSLPLKTPFWPALAFSTRPLSIQEIILIKPEVLKEPHLFEQTIMAFRGAKIIRSHEFCKESKEGITYSIPHIYKEKINIALTSFETTENTYEMVIKGSPVKSLERYEKINSLINNILRSNTRKDYIVFPECSIPRRWALNIAKKLGMQGISFIAGLEYYRKNGDPKLRNDSLISLCTYWPGYLTNLLFMQSKMNPSYDEVLNLKKLNKELFIPEKKDESVIYMHGDYFFGVLICSDLTNPRNRVRLQGKIDTLFVLEWNSDVNTFGYLIEGAAHDIHSFIVQVNNRMYGDSRLRTPYRESFKRDMVKLKGGIDDFFVIAEIEYLPLREYQLNGVMTDSSEAFKPVPIGFDLSPNRIIKKVFFGESDE
ncbi:RNA-directed DNA polymerase [Leclercia adecarboxylata]|uniref:RNA-directed DNA polymerase n=3 Tax=Leclercia adecarboxylata TaxID=83655 RepID=A0A9X3YB07_9ENTR|nr:MULTISPECIES: RNA-directed DNA polymerase [Bacteria]MDC6623155.1 RNA-directed DNA polymerase [Leclercia adecarboxylata]MDC6633746.1 RNA-directed DNA polymerase [Leclercia adecarboxylata]MDC6639357.1 RNA-directed DNA polymerase [Leclercia adecarboxylata]MDC6649515.1 RNA-directed DNA polymerase [Leclercia adecarboxylata]MDC6655306.1 RNA-directed DNA polymerase [Leclercia adecarboxylata]